MDVMLERCRSEGNSLAAAAGDAPLHGAEGQGPDQPD
jgi:hypothetical protein